jgi:hypothetical protein
MTESVVVSEWSPDLFHQKVVELERVGYVSRLESYRIVADMNPENGIIRHVYSMELNRPEQDR